MNARSASLASAMVLMVTTLAGCGSDDTTSNASKGKPESQNTTRVVEGAYGDIEIPTEPKRIVGDLMTLDYLTALGYDTSTVVGLFDAKSYASEDNHYLHEQVSRPDLVDPGFLYEARVEDVAAAKPDLILVPFDQIDGSEVQDELAEIAPLLVVPTSDSKKEESRYAGTASFQDWRGTLREYGKLLEREDEAEAYIAETDAQIEALRTEHADAIEALEVVQAKSTPDYVAITPLTTDQGALGSILLNEIGFHQPERLDDVKPDEWGTIDISEENTDLLDGDLLFLEVREGSKEHEKSPLWAQLDVVRTGGVVTVGNHWEFGGAIAAREVIKDIDAALDAR